MCGFVLWLRALSLLPLLLGVGRIRCLVFLVVLLLRLPLGLSRFPWMSRVGMLGLGCAGCSVRSRSAGGWGALLGMGLLPGR